MQLRWYDGCMTYHLSSPKPSATEEDLRDAHLLPRITRCLIFCNPLHSFSGWGSSSSSSSHSFSSSSSSSSSASSFSSSLTLIPLPSSFSLYSEVSLAFASGRTQLLQQLQQLCQHLHTTSYFKVLLHFNKL